RCAWLGAGSHPNGNASPHKNTSAGISKATTIPPALKSNHSNGSIGRLGIHPPSRSHATSADATAQAAQLEAVTQRPGIRLPRRRTGIAWGARLNQVTAWKTTKNRLTRLSTTTTGLPDQERNCR